MLEKGRVAGDRRTGRDYDCLMTKEWDVSDVAFQNEGLGFADCSRGNGDGVRVSDANGAGSCESFYGLAWEIH